MAEMLIQVPEVPTSTRVPGKYFAFDTRLSNAGMPSTLQKVLLIGQRTAAGGKPALEPVDIFKTAEAEEHFGSGSQLHRMALAAVQANPFVNLSCIALDDAGAGVAAAGSVQFTAAPTTAGVYTLWVGDGKVEIAVDASMTVTEIAAALVAQIGKQPALPVSAAVNGVDDTIADITAKNKGVQGNGILLADEMTAKTLATTVAVMAAGASDPDIQDALDVVKPVRYNIIVSAYNDATSLQALRDHMDEVGGPIEQRGAVGIAGFTGAYADGVTLASGINSGRTLIASIRGTKTHPIEVAARFGSAKGYIEDPAQPLNNLYLRGIAPPAQADRYTWTEMNNMLHNGLTPLEVRKGDKVVIVRAVSTYTVNDAAVDDPALLDITTICSLDYVRDAVKERLTLRFPAPKFTKDFPDRVITEVVDVLYKLDELQVVRETDHYKDLVVAQGNLTDVTRLDIEIPAAVVAGAHVIAGNINLFLDNRS
jgi:phage tail sheath gpL-like